MSETNFFGLSRGHYDPLASASRQPTTAERPAEPPVTAGQVHQSVTKTHSAKALDTVARPHLPAKSPAVKHHAPKPVVAPKLVPTAPKPAVAPAPAPAVAAPKLPSPVIPLDDLLSDFIDNQPRIKKPTAAKKRRAELARRLAARKQAKSQARAEKRAAKQTAKVPKTPKAEKAQKTPKAPKTPELPKPTTAATDQTNTDFAARALTAAADTTTALTNATGTPPNLAMNSGGEVAVEDRLPKIALEVKINKRYLLAFIRGLIILAILAISGYLAWDTWLTNKAVQETFSNPVAAVAIDEVGPSDADTTSVSNQAWAAYTVPADQARYLYLPTINASARVLSVGINSKGRIDTAKNVNDAAWYDGSAKPGQEGQVFINGHASSTSAYKAVFDDLPKLQIGAQIIIERGDGKQIAYRVVNSETVSTEKVDMKAMLNVPTGVTKGLTIMSYTGKYNYRTQSSDTRVIVYAVQE